MIQQKKITLAMWSGLAVVLGLSIFPEQPTGQQPTGQQPTGQQPTGQQPTAERLIDVLGDPLPSHATMRLGTLRFRHPAPVVDMALSPDQKTIVTAGRWLIGWDVATGSELWRHNAEEAGLKMSSAGYGLRVICFTADSRQFFTPGRRNEMLIWNTLTGDRRSLSLNSDNLKQLQQDTEDAFGSARSVDLSPDQLTLAFGSVVGLTVCDRQGIVLYEVRNQPPKPIAPEEVSQDRLLFNGHYSYGRFSPDGQLLAVVTSDRPQQIRLLAAVDGRLIREIPTTARVVRMEFSPDSERIAVTERDSSVRLYQVGTGMPVWSHVVPLNNPYENYTSAVAVSPDGRIVAAAATDNRIVLLDAATGSRISSLKGHAWYPWTLAFTNDSSRLYSAGWDGPIRRWDLTTKQQLGPPMGLHGSPIVATAPDGRTLACCDDPGATRLINVSAGTEQVLPSLPGLNVTQLAFSTDGRMLAGGGNTETDVVLVVWDTDTRKMIQRWQWPKGKDPHSHVEAVAFSSDGSHVAAAVFRQSSAYLWNLKTGRQIAELKHTQVYGLSFSADGGTLATAGWDRMIRLWDSTTGKLQREYNTAGAEDRAAGGDRRMYAICYAPSGRYLATAHMDGIVRIWQAEDLTLLSRFSVTAGFVYGALSFSANGSWLATGNAAGSVDVWHPQTGQKVLEVGRHQSYVYTVGFSHDGRTLVSGGDDGVAYQWALHRMPEDRQETAELWKQFTSDDVTVSYQARFGLQRDPDSVVGLIAEKLRPVRIVIDLHAAENETAVENRERRRAMILQLVEKEPQTELLQTVNRSISLLAELRSEQSLLLLQELSEKQDSVIGELAAVALQQNGFLNK